MIFLYFSILFLALYCVLNANSPGYLPQCGCDVVETGYVLSGRGEVCGKCLGYLNGKSKA